MNVAAIVDLQLADLEQLRDLLSTNHLPADDCAEQLPGICGIFEGGKLIVAGGLEPAAPYALLRSVVVHPEYRGCGLAQRVTLHLLQRAEKQAVAAVFLLTETAETWFVKFGFRRVQRAQVPQAVRSTQQFASLCPQSASCMRLDPPFAPATGQCST